MDLDQLLAEYHTRIIGTKIRGQTVESVEICVDTIDGPDWTKLRYFLFVHFREPKLPENMNKNLKLLRRVFWDTTFATVKLDAGEVRSVLMGEQEVPKHQWMLSDEMRGEI